jgi:hypothetical protein
MAVIDERKSSFFKITVQEEKIKLIELPVVPLVFSDKQLARELIFSPIDGIKKFGPYDINTADRHVSRKFKGVDFFVFYPKNEKIVRKTLEELISMLRDGYSDTSGKFNFRGFEKEFKLKAFIPKEKEFFGYTPGNLRDELRSLKHEFEINEENRPVVIVGGTSHRSIKNLRYQYLEAKRQFTDLDVPCQYASYYERETGGAGILFNIKNRLSINYSLWNFALNIYGKIGGLAWIIRQESPVIDLSIGMRFVQSKNKKGYVVGYITILDRFGRLIGVVSSPSFELQIKEGFAGMVVPSDIMEGIIKEVLKKALSDTRVKKIFSEKETINVSVHRLSAFHPLEIQGIDSAIKSSESSGKEIKYALISISSDPITLAFSRTGEKYWNPKRGTAIRLDDKVAVLYSAGAHKESEKLLYPIIIICQNLGEEKCPFSSIEEVCNHVYALTNLHWQTVIPGSVKLPATLEFAQNIAQLSSFEIMPKEGSWLWQTFWFV